MAVTISNQAKEKFLAAHFDDVEIKEILDNAKSGEVVETVANFASFLQINYFLRARIAEMATQGNFANVVIDVVQNLNDLKGLGLNTTQITLLVCNASAESTVTDFLDSIEVKGDLERALEKYLPQTAPAEITAEKKELRNGVVVGAAN